MKILAIDPGWSTGWAYMEFGGGKPEALSQGTIEGGLQAFIEHNPADLVEWYDTTFIIEDFVPDGTIVGREATYSSLIIGAFVMHCAESPAPTFPVIQPRSDKASLYGDTEAERFDFLRRNGFTGTNHELDAITHALVYAKRAGHEGTRRMILNG